jgi:PAS domain-containing protein
MVGKTPFDVWPPDTAARLVARLREIVESQRPLTSEDVLPHPDGDRTMLVHRFPLRDTNGDTSLIAVIGVDITAQKRAETRAKQAMAQSQHATIDLLTQLRGPLDAVCTHARRLQTEHLTPNASDSVEGIVTAAGRLLALIDQRPEIGQIETPAGPSA